MTRGITITILLLVIVSQACEELVDFPDSGKNPAIPVIEAILTDCPEMQKVRVSFSTSIADSVISHPVCDAVVNIVSSEGDTILFEPADSGNYESFFSALPGLIYTLNVTIDDVTYSSSGEVIEMNGIDSLYFRHLKNQDSGDSAYYVFLDAGKSFPEDTRYYLINLTRNKEILTHGSEIWIFNDKYTSSINGLELPEACQKNDTIRVELYSLSKSMYDYYFKLSYEVFSLNLSNISYRANLPQLFKPEALGYFQISSVSRQEIIIGK
jgi:hypothetical protein